MNLWTRLTRQRLESAKATSGSVVLEEKMPVETYVSTDIETDGPIPGRNSMLSIGSAAFTADKHLISSFSANLETVPGLVADERTRRWWKTQPEAWAACRSNPELPAHVFPRYVAWLKSLPGTVVFVGYPAAFDFPFVAWYLTEYAQENPFGYAVIDIKSYAMALMRRPYTGIGKRNMPKTWFDPLPHTHVAIDDAIEQGHLFCNMLIANNHG